MRTRRRLVRSAMALAVFSLLACSADEPVADLLIRGGTLIDGTGREPLRDALVVIRNGRISTVSSGNVSIEAKRELDATGRWVGRRELATGAPVAGERHN